jgi:probable rRNA maturation factor
MKAGRPLRGRRIALALDIQVATRSRRVPASGQFRRWARASLGRPAQVTLRIVGEREATRLNGDFRGQAHATNVLTFCYESEGRLSGDIVLCAPVIGREARAQRKLLRSHYAHLTVHGLLHLQGYDHEDPRQAGVMEAKEIAILRRLGIANPYLVPAYQ